MVLSALCFCSLDLCSRSLISDLRGSAALLSALLCSDLCGSYLLSVLRAPCSVLH
jgi:hypothetical protein